MGKLKDIDWGRFEAHVEGKIIEAGGLPMPGEEKAEKVKQAAKDWLDRAHEPKSPLAEAASNIAITTLVALLGGLIKSMYQKAKAKGLVQ